MLLAQKKFFAGQTGRPIGEDDWPVSKRAKYELRLQGITPLEILNMDLPQKVCDVCGRYIFSSPNDAAIFCGGLSAIDRQVSYGDDGEVISETFSILWDEEGWRGGVGGGIRTACEGEGYENF